MNWFQIRNKNYWRVSGQKEYSLQEIADLSGITVRSLRNYCRAYEELLSPRRGYYNSLVFSSQDLETFVMIKTCLRDGLKQNEIISKILAQRELEALHAEPHPAPSEVENPDLPVLQDIEENQGHLPKTLLRTMNQSLIFQAERTSRLEQKLNRIEHLLEENLKPKAGFLGRTISRIKDSTEAFLDALMRH